MDPKWVVQLQGKSYPLYGGILNEAHERGLASIETTLIQVPNEENGHVAIVKSRVTMKDGGFFEAYGDASPRNTHAKIATALLRMAETRSKGRALRDSVNLGEVMAEELAPEDRDEAPRAQPTRTRTAETLERAERPMPISTPGEPPARPEKGFEERFVDESGKVFRRVDLVKFAESSLGEALKLGLLLEPISPAVATNEHLVAWGKRVRPILAAARKSAEVAA